MLSRSSAIMLSLTSSSAGVMLGIVLARGGPSISAQVAGPARTETQASPSRQPAPTSRLPSRSSGMMRFTTS